MKLTYFDVLDVTTFQHLIISRKKFSSSLGEISFLASGLPSWLC